MLGKSEMNTLYAQTAPLFLTFLQKERDKISSEIQRLRRRKKPDPLPPETEQTAVVQTMADPDPPPSETEQVAMVSPITPDPPPTEDGEIPPPPHPINTTDVQTKPKVKIKARGMRGKEKKHD